MGAALKILPIAQRWGGGTAAAGGGGGVWPCTDAYGVDPSVSRYATATSPLLREGEDLKGTNRPTPADLGVTKSGKGQG